MRQLVSPAALGDLREGLRGILLLELQIGSHFTQKSSVMLPRALASHPIGALHGKSVLTACVQVTVCASCSPERAEGGTEGCPAAGAAAWGAVLAGVQRGAAAGQAAVHRPGRLCPSTATARWIQAVFRV